MIIERSEYMAQRPLKPCKYIGCHVLHRNKGLYCDEHQELHDKKLQEGKIARQNARLRKAGYQLSDEEKFYSSRQWQRTRQLIKESQGFLCLNCLDNGVYTEGKHIHHIMELLEDWDLRLDPDNLICLCGECHRGIHLLYNRSDEDRINTQVQLKKILKTYREGGYKIGS